MRRALAVLSALLVLPAVSSCGDQHPAGPAGKLVVSPNDLTFDYRANGTVFLTAEPTGPVDWQVAGKPVWLVTDRSGGTVTDGIEHLILTYDSTKTSDAGTITGNLEVIGEGSGTFDVTVRVTVAPRPIATLDVEEISIDEDAAMGSVRITNTGRGALDFTASADQPWLDVAPATASVAGGETVLVRLSPVRTGLPAGTARATLMIESNSVDGDATVDVEVKVAPEPVAEWSARRAVVPDGETEGTIILSNAGNSPVEWSIVADDGWAEVTPSSGTIEMGGEQILTVEVDRGRVGVGGSTALRLTSNSAVSPPAPAVVVAGPAAPTGAVWVLDHRVVDAEYSSELDAVITVSANPARLNIVEAGLGIVHSVDLPRTPTAVAVRPDGEFAVVGHDGMVTWVDLVSASVVSTSSVSTVAHDLVYGPADRVHVIPRMDQWEDVRTVDLATGSESLSQGRSIRAGSFARLHPSGEAFYAGSVGSSPGDFERWGTDPVALLWDSPYHGDFRMGGNLWFSEDGNFLYAQALGEVFSSSPEQSQDMRYRGSLAESEGLRWLADSEEAGRLWVAADNEPEVVRVYETAFWTSVGTLELPDFSGAAISEGRFLFPNADGSMLWVVVQARGGAAKDWGVVPIDTGG